MCIIVLLEHVRRAAKLKRIDDIMTIIAIILMFFAFWGLIMLLSDVAGAFGGFWRAVLYFLTIEVY